MKRSLVTFLFLFIVLLLNAQVRVYTPLQRTPVDSAVNQMPNTVLNWYAVSGSVNLKYEVVMDTTPLFNSPLKVDTIQTLLSGYRTHNLIFGRQYFWKVRAMDNGNTSDWSPVRNFTVFNTLEIDAPACLDSAQMADVAIKWKATILSSTITGIVATTITGVSQYEYQVDTTVSFNSPKLISGQVAGTVFTATMSTLRFGTVYFWRVRAKHAGGVSGWSEVWGKPALVTNKTLKGVTFPSSSTAFAAGSGGTILKSLNAGKTWFQLTSGSTANLNSINFFAPSKGYAVGEGGVILTSTNSGSSWAVQTSGTTVNLNCVYFQAASTGYIAGDNGTILKTTDGTAWTAKTSGTTKNLKSIYFANATVGYAVGESGTILKTTDGGGTWTVQTSGTTVTLNAVNFVDASNGFAAGASGTILKTSNGGTTWTAVPSGITTDLNGVFFNNTLVGIVVGKSGVIRKTFNGGNFFVNCGNYTTNDINGIAFGQLNTAVLCGTNGLVLSTVSGGVTWNFRTVTSFILGTTPANGALKQMLNVTLNWTKYTGLLAYQYQIALDGAFTNVVAEGETTTNSVNASFLKFGNKYYWRVRGRHIADTSDWSAVWNFTSTNTVDLKSPANTAQGIPVKPVFIWTKQTGILNFELQVDSIASFPNPILDVKPGVNDTLYGSAKKLVANTLYYWRMRAISNGGLTADTTDWSPVWKFSTIGATGISEKGFESFALYPNPASGKIYMKLDVSESVSAQFELFNLVGTRMITRSIDFSRGANTVEMTLGDLQQGVYMARITIEGRTINRKVIVQ
jgi:photosystem II stability/assembly factor-like uncharacterized protein